ncbi:MAG: reverse gyrase [Desulfurococcales archaeon]|nr:reverse gyrase [Desulfurococcales archaeon]
MTRIQPIIRHMCPNCGGPIEASRLERGLPCAACLEEDTYYDVKEIGEALKKKGKLKRYAWLYNLEIQFEKFASFFYEKTGSNLWSAQASWAKRLLMLESIAIIAPTGVGKSTLLEVYAAYRSENDRWRVLYIVPTQNLVRQVAQRLSQLTDSVVYYTGSMSKKLREEALSRIQNGDFRILVITTSFLSRNFTLLERNSPFQLIIVDDVDSLLKSGTNVDRVLRLMGFSDRTIETAERLVKTRFKFYEALSQGKEEKIRELQSKLAELETELIVSGEPVMSQLVIASATGRPRGIKHYLFKELLGFEVGGGSDYMRSVDDAYVISTNPVDEAVSLVERLGSGTIVFVSQLLGKQTAKLIAEKLKMRGVKVVLALAGSRRAISKLVTGEADVVVGVASRYGVIVRGIDLPEKIKYAVFIEIPARKMRLEDALASPRRQLALLLSLEEKGYEVEAHIKKLAKLVEKLPDTRIATLAYKGKISVDGLLAELVEAMKEAANVIKKHVAEILRVEGGTWRIGGSVLRQEDSGIYLIIPDAPTYLQASGRTSRLLKGVMTHGLSVVVSSSEEYVKALAERLKWYTNSSFNKLTDEIIERAAEKIEATRKGKGKKVRVKTVLLVVESPTKARTIAWFWGRPGKRRLGKLTVYEASTADPETGDVYLLLITASRGHVLELAVDEEGSLYGVRYDNGVFKPVYTTIKRCHVCGYTYAGEGPCPRCGSTSVSDSMAVIEALRKMAMEVDEIIIATDPDREGEKIAWDIYLALRPYNRNIKRGKFHEVTRRAIMEALRNPQAIEKNLVTAQIVRRIEDRWIGFSLSSHLWAVYGKQWLGAGRVQTPVLGWAIERYKEWKDNKGYATLLKHEPSGGRLYVFTEDKPNWKTGDIVEAVVESYEEWVEEVTPPPPFTTDELLYEASRRLGFSASMTMKIAQDLFESGLITYHRTDSTRVSPTGIGIAKEYLEKVGMIEEHAPRPWGEGGAHEAIRPTKPLDATELRRKILEGTLRVQTKLTWAHFKLYDLIFRRFIASQMKSSNVKRARVVASVSGLKVEREGIIEYGPKGFARVSPPLVDKVLKTLVVEGKATLKVWSVKRSSRVRLYKAGDLVKLMKKAGIGRPSTYAKAIEANRRHGYIILSKKLQYVVPTRLGIQVYEYLSTNFSELVSLETSRRLEELLDRIAMGEEDAAEALEDIASKISTLVEGSGLEIVSAEAI